MFNALYNAMLEWNRTADERVKMQHTLLTLALVALVACGLISLLDSGVGRDLLIIPAGFGAIFLVNAIVWSLVDSVIIKRLSNRHKR